MNTMLIRAVNTSVNVCVVEGNASLFANGIVQLSIAGRTPSSATTNNTVQRNGCS